MESQNHSEDTPAGSEAALARLSENYRGLRVQFLSLMIAVVVFALGANMFIFKQVSLANKQKVELDQVVNEYKDKTAPKMNEFVTRLREFGRTHPDFEQILRKYVSTNAAPVALPPSAAAPKAGTR